MTDKEQIKGFPERVATVSGNTQTSIIAINPDLFYSKTMTKQMLHISETAYSNYRKEGLLAHKVGMEVYTRGSELIDFILTREGNPNLYTNEKRKNRKRK